jgi:hypothetical protein
MSLLKCPFPVSVNRVTRLESHAALLGFKETWRGGSNPAELSWINMRVPDGTDYVEFMLYRKVPATFGGSNHIPLRSLPYPSRSCTVRWWHKLLSRQKRELVVCVLRK